MRGTSSPPVTIPARFSGSVAETDTWSTDSSRETPLSRSARLRQRELLAGEAADEAAAAHLAARLQRR